MKHYLLEVGENYVWWLWVAIEPIYKIVIGLRIFVDERNMLVAEQFIQKLATEYGKQTSCPY